MKLIYSMYQIGNNRQPISEPTPCIDILAIHDEV
jgi:hypothetical protein